MEGQMLGLVLRTWVIGNGRKWEDYATAISTTHFNQGHPKEHIK